MAQGSEAGVGGVGLCSGGRSCIHPWLIWALVGARGEGSRGIAGWASPGHPGKALAELAWCLPCPALGKLLHMF